MNNCGTCKHWCSFAARYEDPLEPDDVGVCENLNSPENGTTSSDDTCDHFELEQ